MLELNKLCKKKAAMEPDDLEEEKFERIRLTLRKVFLPLGQAIYDENPSDILLFCSQYFHNLVQKRGDNDGNTNDQSLDIGVDESSHKKEEGTKHRNSDEGTRATESSSSNAQGSSSEPLLTSDKHAKCSNVRETSSWHASSDLSQSVVPRTVLESRLADEICQIGDQPSPERCHKGFEKDRKAGDTNANLNEDKVSDDYNSLEEHNVENDLTAGTTQTSLASPNYNNDDNDSKQEFKESRLMKTNESADGLKTINFKTSTPDTQSYEKIEIKESCKQPSPNSSFGFIPHLNEYYSEEDRERSIDYTDDDLKFKIKTSSDTEHLTKKILETFQGLAQEFSSAESNFDTKFKNAKEIGDVIQKRQDTKETNLDRNFEKIAGMVNDKENQNGRKDEMLMKPDMCIIDDKNGNLAPDLNDQKVYSELKGESTKSECIFMEEKYEMSTESITEYPELDTLLNHFNQQITSEEEKHSEEENVSEYISHRNDNTDDSNTSDNSESYTTVDESWKRRWYESHPPLDSYNVSFQQIDPRFHRGNASLSCDYRLSNIGDRGDAHPEPFYAQDTLQVETTDESISTSSSTVRKSNSAHDLFSGEVNSRCRRGSNRGRPPGNFMNKDKNIANNPGISPQNIPYSWRRMCKQQPRSAENRVQKFKILKKNSREKFCEFDSEKKGKDMSIKHDHENLSEVVVLRESKETVGESLNNITGEVALKTDKAGENTLAQIYDRNSTEKCSSVKLIKDRNSSTTKIHQGSSTKQGAFKNSSLLNDLKGHKDSFLRNYCGSVRSENSMETFSPDEDLIKHEPGIISAGGDIVADSESSGQDSDSQTSGTDAEDIDANDSENNSKTVGVGGISNEYVQEVIERVIEQQKEAEIADILQFSSYSESDASNFESSDVSEPEDLRLNDNAGEN